MHQKQTIKQHPIFFLHIRCDYRLTSIAYSQIHGHAEISFDSVHDILHCLYLLIYPLFSSTWMQSSESTSRRDSFHDLFEQFGYKWNHGHQEVSHKREIPDEFIRDALDAVREEDEVQISLNARVAMSEEETEMLFHEAFLYPMMEQSFPQQQVEGNFSQLELSAECMVSVNRLKDGIYEMRTETGIFLEVSDVRNETNSSDHHLQTPESQPIETTSLPSPLDTPCLIPQTSPQVQSSEVNSFTDDLDSDFCQPQSTAVFPQFDQNPTTLLHVTKTLLQDSSLRVIGQVDNKYIFFTSSDQLLCVDQHAIHERILLEEMEKKLQNKLIQNSLSSAQIDMKSKVTNLQLHILTNQRYRQYFMGWGFQYSLNKLTLLISTVPVIEGEILTRLDFLEFVDYIYRNQELPILTLKPPSVNRILASKACRSAIKFGDSLPLQRCEELIQQLSTTSFPFQCAHGRPSVVPLFSFSKQG
jgi:DNA mismatch repair ATPase MutL